MRTFYKVFLVVFLIFTAINFYAIDWSLGFMHEENTKFLVSIAAGIAGILLVFVLDMWSRLARKN